MKFFVVLLAVVHIVLAGKKSYEGHKVFKVSLTTKDHIQKLLEVKTNGGVEFWDEEVEVNRDVKVMVGPENQNEFVTAMESAGIVTLEVIKNVQIAIDQQIHPPKRNFRDHHTMLSMSWDVYHKLEDIYNWLDELETNYPEIVKTVVLGKTVEDRDIKGVVINYHPDRKDKQIGMFEGGLHAREWISPATVTWIIKEFLTSTEPEVRALAENFEWHLLPVANPDGYSYTFTDVRMWRKNRKIQNNITCSEGVDPDMRNGIDLNRNFGYVWMSVGASDDNCLNTYAGSTAFSEPETRAIANYVLNLQRQGNLIYYIAFHSYSQLMIVPYSHVDGSGVLEANNYGDMFEVLVRGAAKLEERYGTQYRVGVSADVMYKMSGTSFDWVKHEAKVPMVTLIELRDLGDYGFLLPAEQIVPNNLEIMDALIEMDRTTRVLGYYSASANIVVFSTTLLMILFISLTL